MAIPRPSGYQSQRSAGRKIPLGAAAQAQKAKAAVKKPKAAPGAKPPTAPKAPGRKPAMGKSTNTPLAANSYFNKANEIAAGQHKRRVVNGPSGGDPGWPASMKKPRQK